MQPACANLDLYRGDSVNFAVRVWEDPDRTIPADLTGTSAKAQIRPTVESNVSMEMDCTVSGNEIDVALTASDWALWPADTWTGVWDLQLTESVDVRTIVYGDVKITPDVTR